MSSGGAPRTCRRRPRLTLRPVRPFAASSRGSLASGDGLELPASARGDEVLLPPSLAFGHEAVIAEEAERQFQVFRAIEDHPRAGLPVLIQQGLASWHLAHVVADRV